MQKLLAAFMQYGIHCSIFKKWCIKTSSAIALYLQNVRFSLKLFVPSHGICRIWWVGRVYAPANMRGVLRRGVLREPCRLVVHGRRRGVAESLGSGRVHRHWCPRVLVLCVGMHYSDASCVGVEWCDYCPSRALILFNNTHHHPRNNGHAYYCPNYCPGDRTTACFVATVTVIVCSTAGGITIFTTSYAEVVPEIAYFSSKDIRH